MGWAASILNCVWFSLVIAGIIRVMYFACAVWDSVYEGRVDPMIKILAISFGVLDNEVCF